MNDTMTMTVQEFAEMTGVGYQTASGLLRYLREKGIAQDAGTQAKEGKGRSASLYTFPARVELVFLIPAVAEAA